MNYSMGRLVVIVGLASAGLHAMVDSFVLSSAPHRLPTTRPQLSLKAMSPPDMVDYEEQQIFDVLGGNHTEVLEADRRYAATKQLSAPEEKFFFLVEEILTVAPLVAPILAYATYDPLASSFAEVIDSMANRNWIAVDGGQYQAMIIAPAINGIVIPSVSILFATLIGTTINVLRNRQLEIRVCINQEASQLLTLQNVLDSMPTTSTAMHRYLIEYVSRVIAESQATVDSKALGKTLDSELTGVLSELNKHAIRDSLPGTLIAQGYGACSKLQDERARRISALQSTFPTLHFGIVAALALSICVAFLLECNQQLLVFLNAIQLRILWTMLVGTFSGLFIVCYDLAAPFRGSYQISQSVDQLYTIRNSLKSTLELREMTKSRQ